MAFRHLLLPLYCLVLLLLVSFDFSTVACAEEFLFAITTMISQCRSLERVHHVLIKCNFRIVNMFKVYFTSLSMPLCVSVFFFFGLTTFCPKLGLFGVPITVFLFRC